MVRAGLEPVISGVLTTQPRWLPVSGRKPSQSRQKRRYQYVYIVNKIIHGCFKHSKICSISMRDHVLLLRSKRIEWEEWSGFKKNNLSKRSMNSWIHYFLYFLPECIAFVTRVHCATNNTKMSQLSTRRPFRVDSSEMLMSYAVIYLTIKLWARVFHEQRSRVDNR